MTSHVADDQLSRLLDGDLALTERAAVLDHVSACPACARRQAELVEVAATLRSQPHVVWTSAHQDRVMADLHAGSSRPGGRHAPLVAALLAVLAAVLVAATVVAAPIGQPLATSAFAAVAWLPPLRLASAGQALAALLMIAVLAPALVYPLARWR